MNIPTMASRRQVLKVLLGLGAIWLARRGDFLIASQPPADQLTAKMVSFFHHKPSAAAIGWEYLRNRPMEADPRQLTRLICARWPDRPDHHTRADTGNIQKLLIRQVREDFEHDRIVNVKGWILSETEARLSALAALI